MKKVYLEKRCKSDLDVSDFQSLNEILESTMDLDDLDTLIHLELDNYSSNDTNIIFGELLNLHSDYEDKRSLDDDSESPNTQPCDYYQDSRPFNKQPKATSGRPLLQI